MIADFDHPCFFGNFLLIAMGEPNKLQKIYNYLEKAETFSFLQIGVHFV